jgi:hypothetical protein
VKKGGTKGVAGSVSEIPARIPSWRWQRFAKQSGQSRARVNASILEQLKTKMEQQGLSWEMYDNGGKCIAMV